MYIDKQIKNIFYANKRLKQGAYVNILYEKAQSFFDTCMLNTSVGGILSIPISENIEYIKNSYYGAIWINDILDFSQKIEYYSRYYTNYILSIHSDPSMILKKEDLMIIKKNLNIYSFLCFSENQNSWPMEKIKYIKYGIPEIYSDIEISKKRKDILVINLKKQKQTSILYQYLKENFSSTDMLLENISNISELQKKLSEYKICIDIDNYYNLIFANSCGCTGITALRSNDRHIIKINSSNEILNMIPNLLNAHIDYDEVSKNVITKYDWKKFDDEISYYKYSIINKGFTI